MTFSDRILHMPDKKTIIFIDHGNIIRSKVAGFLTKKELRVRNLHDQYDVHSMRTQGLTDDDPIPPSYPNIFIIKTSTVRLNNGLTIMALIYLMTTRH